MKDQFFGDFGDYQKFSLLKTLRDRGNFKICIHWMKTKNDDTKHGNRISYLNEPQIWDSFNKDIFHFIKGHIDRRERCLALYEKSTHADGIHFINDYIENTDTRNRLLDKIRHDKKSDLIFFDPDNGIEVKSATNKNMHKYVRWEEIKKVFALGKNILIYQCFPREKRDVFIERKLKEIQEHFPTAVFAVKVKHSVYFLITQKRYIERVQRILENYSNRWKPENCTVKPSTK